MTGAPRDPDYPTMRLVKDRGYTIPRIFLLYDLRLVREQLGKYRQGLAYQRVLFPENTARNRAWRDYVAWLTQREKELQTRELLRP